MPSVPRPKSTLGAIVELVAIVGFAIGLALLIQAFVVKPFQIPSESMVPTIEKGQRVLAERVSYRLSDPEIGDIVVFTPPKGAGDLDGGASEPGSGCANQPPPDQVCDEPVDEPSGNNFIKRIVATPGDELYIEDGRAIVNGEPIEDDFIRSCGGGMGCNFPKPITIPEDHYFMMGDNRGQSQDSRFWGPVPRDWIIGKAFATYWPIDRIGIF